MASRPAGGRGALPATLPVPVLAVLHLPRDRSSRIAEVLAPYCALPVREAEDKQPLLRGTVTFAPPDYHLLVEDAGSLALSVDAPVLFSRPAIDPLFESAAAVFGDQVLALLLTGASSDGSEGGAAVRGAGGRAWLQCPEEAEASMMPASALQHAGADAVLPLELMCRRLKECCMNLLLPPDPAQSQSPVNLLIVDDAESGGHAGAIAARGREPAAWPVRARRRWSCCWSTRWRWRCSMHMPEIDGFTLAELMRGSHRSRTVPIIFLTASPDDPLRAFKGYETGAVDFLHKPVAPQVILSKVNVFIELYQQRQLLKARNEALERALKLNETMAAVLTHDPHAAVGDPVVCRQAGAGASGEQQQRAADTGASGGQYPAHGADGRAVAGPFADPQWWPAAGYRLRPA